MYFYNISVYTEKSRNHLYNFSGFAGAYVHFFFLWCKSQDFKTAFAILSEELKEEQSLYMYRGKKALHLRMHNIIINPTIIYSQFSDIWLFVWMCSPQNYFHGSAIRGKKAKEDQKLSCCTLSKLASSVAAKYYFNLYSPRGKKCNCFLLLTYVYDIRSPSIMILPVHREILC